MTLTRLFDSLLALAGVLALAGTLAAADWQALARLDTSHAQDLFLPLAASDKRPPLALPASLELPRTGPLARSLLGNPARYVF
ncbi:hypothetical protein [Pseudomonas sp. zfem005]|uniref:hypothetical protein n=1 Tax=Pseudomonas sp. zfem005 TaxID=3078200 RepID=UPI002929A212|nr:hypothetical protein [Pseudomonas sp. zfem005]MDU9415756.1 hypothetical protein [Pseudomonas sp. zfem005]